MATAAPDRCPSCGAERPAGSPRGHCPRCLLRQGLAGGSLSLWHAGEFGAIADFSGCRVPETLAATVGPVPRVLLRDADTWAEPPVVRPPDRTAAGLSIRYRIDGEIARGGMGEVLKGRDPDIGRDVAIKVLRDDLSGRPEMVGRFVEEAQIGGQLEHPGIVPVYELGTFADRRPFFSMKLVRGQTFAQLLAARLSPADGLPRSLGIFEQVAQTVAYAHARGVIHRDLKPSNVMVGSFGEVQVMDWGLAKVLPLGGVADDEQAGRVPERDEVIATARSGGAPDVELSLAGSVLGTPSYMAPEQARGEIGAVDERADVFALGSILCEVLTGSPAFTGRTSAETQRRAARADVADARARLDACGADAELVALARDCLAAEPSARPRHAGAVRERITAYLAGVQERLRAAEIERARAEARAAEERRRRRLQLGLAASLLALVSLGCLAFTYELHRRQARAARADRLLAAATVLRDQARAQREDVARWVRAREALDQIGEELGPSAAAALRREVDAGRAAALADRALVGRLVDIRSIQADDPGGSAIDAAYADAFTAAGIDPDRRDPAEAGARVARRPKPVAAALVAALDHWSAVRRARDPQDPGWARALAAARAADCDPDRDALRAALLLEDKAARLGQLRPLAERSDAGSWAPASLILLGEALANADDADTGIAVLRRASWSHPHDAGVHYALGQLLERVRPPQPEEAIRAYSVSWGRQPELAAHELAHALERRGRGAEAEMVWRDLVGRRPDDGRHLGCFGRHLTERGRRAQAAPVLGRAVAACREATRLRPDDAVAHNNLALALNNSGDRHGAIAEFRDVIRLRPTDPQAHFNLGNALYNSGDRHGAMAEYREAIRRKPDYADAHSNLGLALGDSGDRHGAIAEYREAIRRKPDLHQAHNNLGLALNDSGDRPEAIAALREATRLKPDDAVAHFNLGTALYVAGDRHGATAALREAIRLRPDHEAAHNNLGLALDNSGDGPGAIAEYREAIRLKPAAEAHYNLGNALRTSGDLPGAVASYREAIRLKPDYAEAHCNHGLALRQQGLYAESLAEFRVGHELGSKRADWRYSSAKWVARAEQLAALADRLPAILRGDDRPADNAERLALASIFYATKRHAAAARRWAEAFEADPKLADDLPVARRYDAACAAALAGCGRGNDDPPPDESARADLRGRALDWLRADLALHRKQLDTDDAACRRALDDWRMDPDLAGVRDVAALAALPEAERDEWRALWVEVDRLLKGAGKAP
jgi:eukaryotic-like serine/threonine-protein kinase